MKISSKIDLAALLCVVLCVSRVHANPTGLSVQSGSATAVATGNQLTVSASQNAFLNWQSFNIASGETTRFVQPSASSIVWNQINAASASEIYGNLQANGVVVLMNHSGFFFGPNSFVNAAGLVVSTASVTPMESTGGLFWQFNGAPPQASIINYGHLSTERGGSLFLIAEQIENHGALTAPHGNVGLMGGKEVLLSERPDGRSLTATVQLPSGTVDNSGRIIADAGTIALNAQVVNQNGLLQANSMREHNGVIELLATDSVELGEHSEITAHGDAHGTSNGGRIQIKSDGSFADSAGSRLNVAGGNGGGDGGSIELSASSLATIHSQLDGQSGNGNRGGTLLLDPIDIMIGNNGAGTIGNGTTSQSDPPTTLNLNVNSSFKGFSQIDLQASHNITLLPNTTWNLALSTGINQPGSLLKLEAGNDISLANGASIQAGQNWSLSLQAGRNFGTPNLVTPGVGNITLSGSASLEAQNGAINLLTGNNISVAGGFVRTLSGGNIDVSALAGSVNSGTHPNGFDFRPTSPGYLVDPDLGGISTANGGNVTIAAGLDIISYLPPATGIPTDGGSGAFGSAPGNVTLSAGRDVIGHFVVANGTGVIHAGRDAGAGSSQLALSLVSGGWEVDAGRDIVLQEVRNPNGVFNSLGFGSSPTRHLFDYSSDAYTILDAGRQVQVTGSALPRNDDSFEEGIPPIYPGRLDINAGSGGVVLGNDVTLFPSPQGDLRVSTSDGGGLVGEKPGDLAQLVMSDSNKTQYRAAGDFGISDHAATPLHLNNPNPVRLDISGDMTSVLIGSPKATQINVGGNMINSRFEGQNLREGDVTSIHVAGDILNRSEFTTVPVSVAPDFTVFYLLYPPLPSLLANLPNQFFYDPAIKTLTFQGRMTTDQLQTLLNLQVTSFDQFGQPLLDPQGNSLTHLGTFTSASALQQLFANSQDIPLNPNTGYRLGGGGTFAISAQNLDLGSTAGIVSEGPAANHALANYFTHGANINVTLGGNLDMFSTTISSLNGGAISVTANGSINVGSTVFHGNDTTARGIFTVDRSDVTVTAGGNINVNGSRIAAYDGGNVTVESLNGNVDAGTGGLGSTPVEKIVVDPVTRKVVTYTPTIPGSGILATTFPPSLDPHFPASRNQLGNILVETPSGNISTGSGGITQIPLNGIGNNLGTVTLRAGTTDAAGNIVKRGNIDATGSGVIGSTVHLEASGEVSGVVVARADLQVSARESVNVTALAQGNATLSSEGTVSGTVIGIGSVNASGTVVDASLLSQNIATSGTVTSDRIGFVQGAAANSTSQGFQKEDADRIVTTARPTADEEELQKRAASAQPKLTRNVGRVTIIGPKD